MKLHAAPSVPTASHDLGTLADLGVSELRALYATASVPAKLDALEGAPRGRMLAVRKLDHGLRGRVMRRWASRSGFPWEGKTFLGRGSSGSGINRIHLWGRHKLFPFRTSLAPSVIDGRPCIALNYDHNDNPSLVRNIHDEIREIEPGLFLGPAMLRTGDKPMFVLWFALDTRIQAT